MTHHDFEIAQARALHTLRCRARHEANNTIHKAAPRVRAVFAADGSVLMVDRGHSAQPSVEDAFERSPC